MNRFLKCPVCGHKTKVPKEHQGGSLQCAACDEYLNASPRAVERGPAKKPKPATGPKPSFLKRVLAEPFLADEGILPGVLSGILAGLVGTIVAGVFSDMFFGEIVASAFLGCAAGLVIGAFLGTFFRLSAGRLSVGFRFKPGLTVLLIGAIIGAAVSAIINPYKWIPLGAGLGAAGYFLWVFVYTKVEPTLNPPKPLSQEEEDYLMDAAAKSKRRQSLDAAWNSQET
jgi:hypothetical protein